MSSGPLNGRISHAAHIHRGRALPGLPVMFQQRRERSIHAATAFTATNPHSVEFLVAVAEPNSEIDPVTVGGDQCAEITADHRHVMLR